LLPFPGKAIVIRLLYSGNVNKWFMSNWAFKMMGLLLVVVSLSGCAYGVLGKRTVEGIKDLNSAENAALNRSRDSLVSFLLGARRDVFNYLDSGAGRTAHNVSVGLLQGSIEALSDSGSRDMLARFFDSIITHAGSSSRIQLTIFKDSLLSDATIYRLRILLQSVMHELVVRPSENLLNMALSDHTRRQSELMLRMVVPAVLNDSTLRQLSKLRTVMLGPDTRNEIADILDAGMKVIDRHLKDSIGNTVVDIVKQSSGAIKKDAYGIFSVIGVVLLVIGVLMFILYQHYRMYKNRKLLYYLTAEIERFREVDEKMFHKLTENIRRSMMDKRMEKMLSEFLLDEKINKS
jgi:hypothetical protein